MWEFSSKTSFVCTVKKAESDKRTLNLSFEILMNVLQKDIFLNEAIIIISFVKCFQNFIYILLLLLFSSLVVEWKTGDQRAAALCPSARHFTLCLVLVQPRKTVNCSDMTGKSVDSDIKPQHKHKNI